MPKGHPHHKMYEKHSKGGHVEHMGKDHWEKKEPELATSDMKYIDNEMGNPEQLTSSVRGLASYVKKNEMKY